MKNISDVTTKRGFLGAGFKPIEPIYRRRAGLKPAPTTTCGFFIIRGVAIRIMSVSVKHALFFPVYERAMPAMGTFRCLRCMRNPLSPIAGMARSYTNIGAVSSFGGDSGAMKVSVKNIPDVRTKRGWVGAGFKPALRRIRS